MDETTRPIGEMSFREAMAEAEGIVGLLESNSLELEESLARFERGVALIADLRRRLADAQQKVDVLMGSIEPAADDAATDTTLS